MKLTNYADFTQAEEEKERARLKAVKAAARKLETLIRVYISSAFYLFLQILLMLHLMV